MATIRLIRLLGRKEAIVGLMECPHIINAPPMEAVDLVADVVADLLMNPRGPMMTP
jgi:hypothetical protein